MEVGADFLGEGCLGAVFDRQNAVFGHDRVELLLVVGHARGERGEVPMQVCVALSAAKAHGVHPLGRHRRGEGMGDGVHDALEGKEPLPVHVMHPAFQMALRCDQAVADQGRPAGKEGDGVVVLIDQVMPVVGVAGDERTDEAGAFADPARI